jgi:putative redox protein
MHGAEDQILWSGEADVEISGRSFKIKKHFLDDLKSYDMTAVFKKLNAAVLIFHAPHDSTVNIKNASYIFSLAQHPKSFISLDSADHLIMNNEDAKYIASSISAWASRYIQFDCTEEKHDEKLGDGVVVTETDEGLYTQRVYAGNHIMRADEPLSVSGGLDLGPSPYEYLLAGLGSCTSMTIRMYAQHKGISLDKVTVELEHDRIYAQDCDSCETEKGMVDVIRRKITLEGPLSGLEKKAMLEIADKCPVHRTLTREIRIETELKTL